MRGISEGRLREIANQTHESDDTNHAVLSLLDYLLSECKELQEPWMTLNEFLKSDFQGLCWMLTIYNDVVTVKFFDDKFILVTTGVCVPFKFVTHVMPIHKPEPPK